MKPFINLSKVLLITLLLFEGLMVHAQTYSFVDFTLVTPTPVYQNADEGNYTVHESRAYRDVVKIIDCVSDTSNHLNIRITDPAGFKTGSEVTVYPNPNNGIFTLMIKNTVIENYDISVFNGLGVLVYQLEKLNVNGLTHQVVDLHALPDGIYTLIVTNGYDRLTQKVVIDK
jgi:hypothetical protein